MSESKEQIKVSVSVDLWGVFWSVVLIIFFFGDEIIAILEKLAL